MQHAHTEPSPHGWKRWLQPAPGSIADQERRAGRSPWLAMVHLAWSVWVFLTPLFSGGEFGFTPRWFALTAITYPLFLWLYFLCVFAPPRRALACAWILVLMCLLLLRWYPSGLSYFVFGCVMLQPRRNGGVYGYLALLVALNLVLVLLAAWIGYAWQALLWIPTVTAIIAVIVMVDRASHQKDAALKLSHEEVRRLAALAERERIGRDLHDLLGHTLSMVALKSELAARLVTRDPAAAGGEMREVGTIAREALTQVRQAISGIRTAGIAAELASARLLLETDGIAFDYVIEQEFAGAALDPAAENALAMALREAVTNIQRHARAHRASVRFSLEHGEALVRIDDDGRGGAVAPGTGLSGMRERLASVGGELRIARAAGGGIEIEARVPIRRGLPAQADAPASPSAASDDAKPGAEVWT